MQGDWEGGGFGYTLPFANREAAEQWGRDKARFHCDAQITVIDRGPQQPDLTPEGVDAEVRRLEADEHYNALKRTRVLEERRVAFAHRNDIERDGWPR